MFSTWLCKLIKQGWRLLLNEGRHTAPARAKGEIFSVLFLFGSIASFESVVDLAKHCGREEGVGGRN